MGHFQPITFPHPITKHQFPRRPARQHSQSTEQVSSTSALPGLTTHPPIPIQVHLPPTIQPPPPQPPPSQLPPTTVPLTTLPSSHRRLQQTSMSSFLVKKPPPDPP
jgi:hypothetical protein